MKVDDAVETISRFFNDLIGSLVPGAVLAVGLVVMHLVALWTTALALVALVAAAYERWHFTGFSKAQEGRKVTFEVSAKDELLFQLFVHALGMRRRNRKKRKKKAAGEGNRCATHRRASSLPTRLRASMASRVRS